MEKDLVKTEPLELVLLAERCCPGRLGDNAAAWAAVEAEARRHTWRSMDPPTPDGAYAGDDKLAHEFTLVAAASSNRRWIDQPGTLRCQHCGLEDWSRRREQECSVRLRAALEAAQGEATQAVRALLDAVTPGGVRPEGSDSAPGMLLYAVEEAVASLELARIAIGQGASHAD